MVGDGGDEATTERTTTMESGEEDGDITRRGGDEVEEDRSGGEAVRWPWSGGEAALAR